MKKLADLGGNLVREYLYGNVEYNGKIYEHWWKHIEELGVEDLLRLREALIHLTYLLGSNPEKRT